MFFQVNVTPKAKKVAEPKSPVISSYSLLLAPFQPPTRIKLDTRLGTSVECQLEIKNTNNRHLNASMTKIPPQERCIHLSATEWSIQPESNVHVTISWQPQEAGSWRDILQLTDSRKIKYDIPLMLSCVDPNKKANEKGRGKTKRSNPLVTKTSNVSNVHKNNVSNTLKSNVTSNKTYNLNQQTIVKSQPPVKRSVNEITDKENVTNNVGFNWMLEQARAKKQKKEPLPPPAMNFSQVLDSSAFKFTPIKTKFSCFETTQETTTFTPRQDIVDQIDSSWFLKQESITIESKTTLRKETYVTVPKFLKVPSNASEDKKSNEFDDSLSPKTETDNNSKSEISMMLKDIKFTPLKIPNKGDDDIKFTPLKIPNKEDDIQFSPTCFSTTTKSDKSKSLSDDSMNNSSKKNTTFDVDSKQNSTYELLPTSPTSTRVSLGLKPMCLAKTFEKPNVDLGFSTPHQTGRQSNQFSRSQIDCGSARDCVEADLWVKTKNTSLSPISKSMLHSTLDSIKEEDIESSDESKRSMGEAVQKANADKQPQAFCIQISPPKKNLSYKKPFIRKISPTKSGKIMKDKSASETMNLKKRIQINKSFKGEKSIQIPGVKISKLDLSALREKSKSKTPKKTIKEVSVKLHDPNDFLSFLCNPDPFAATMTCDPFLSSTLYYDEKWIFIQEVEFKKWLNALLTPPEHLSADIESATVDIGKVWQSCRMREDVTLAETKESLSARYHTNTKLNTLRKAACAMFRRPEIIKVLSQTTVGIEKEILLIRSDKDLHRDIGLQKMILEILLSYNPLWLRIGLEVVYGETIPLASNNDLVGLSRFLLNRFFSDPFIVKQYSASGHPNIRLKTFQPVLNKFMMKKFLFLVYFLDYSKSNKLIGHDPCLFHKKATIKDSRSVLLTFSREVLSGIGDITKVLRNYGYVVSHKQTHLDEYDYAVKDLSSDLRDGVRLCRVMELITGKKSLTCQCRVPAISRLQKVHNVQVALTTLNEAGYTITGNIDAKTIADGHREKTLSLLWQMIYKFQAPRFEKAASIVQRWWRSKLWYVNVKKMLRNRKHNAAATIQRSWRCYLARRELEKLKQKYAELLRKREQAALTIQTHWRRRRQVKLQQEEYRRTRLAAMKIQKWWRRIQSTKSFVQHLKVTKNLLIAVQRRWRATRQMKVQRNHFLHLKNSAVTIQRHWRARCLGRRTLQDYQNKRRIIGKMQSKWRAKLSMRKERQAYLEKLRAIRVIQDWWKRCIAMKRDRANFLALKKAVAVTEKWRIAKINQQRQNFLIAKRSASTIQRAWRNRLATRADVSHYKRSKLSCIKMQSWWRCVVARKQYMKQRASCITIQKWRRNVLATRKQRADFLKLKTAAVTVQKQWRMQLDRREYTRKKSAAQTVQAWYRNILLSRRVRNDYLKMQAASLTIKVWWYSLKLAKHVQSQYLQSRKAIIAVQRRWRAQRAMRVARQDYLNTRNSTVKIQSWWKMIREKHRYQQYLQRKRAATVLQNRWRALKSGREARRTYAKDRSSVILIQSKWRATLLARSERAAYLRMREAAITVQKNWKAFVLSRAFRKTKDAVKIVEKWRVHQLTGRRTRADYMQLKSCTTRIQQLWRRKLRLRLLEKQIKSAIIIQKCWRMHVAVKNFREQKMAAIAIQRRRRHIVMGRRERDRYVIFRENVVKIQRRWRTIRQMREFKSQRRAAVVIQKNWRSHAARREYLNKRQAAIAIQRWRRNLVLGRQTRAWFAHFRKSVVKIQSLWRMLREVREYQRKRQAAIVFQKHWKRILATREYRRKKNAVHFIETRRKHILAGREVRFEYLQLRMVVLRMQQLVRVKQEAKQFQNMRRAAIRIQAWWRGIMDRQYVEHLKLSRQWAVLVIENWWINSSEERRLREIERAELRLKSYAATRIQAAWKGYLTRRSASKKLSVVREKVKQATKEAVPSNTLAFRLQENITIFQYATNIGQLSLSLVSLDIIVRLLPVACTSVCKMNLASKLYDLLTQANRSLPWLDVCLKDVSILLTLAKFEPTKVYVLQVEYIEDLARLLNVSAGKKDDLFLHTATLMWILTDNEEYAEAVRNCAGSRYLLASLYTKFSRKRSKTVANSAKTKDVPLLPNPKPDWGLKHKQPRTFTCVSHAITCLASRLNILNMA